MEQVDSYDRAMEVARQEIKEAAIAEGRPWSLIQQFSIPYNGHFPPCASNFDNFGGLLNCCATVQMYTVYPIYIVEVLNDYYLDYTTRSPYSFRLADIDTIIVRAFPDHPGMVEKGSFLELAAYDLEEVNRRIVGVLDEHYRYYRQ